MNVIAGEREEERRKADLNSFLLIILSASGSRSCGLIVALFYSLSLNTYTEKKDEHCT